ncbi:hypothetical protein [Lautropia dentalis]|nr:hypothetical protein [Lautropia dentalis]
MNASPSPPINHDRIFKNLVQDYPQAALAFFAADEHIGLDDDIEITFLGQEPPETDMTEGKLILDMPIRVRWRDGSREDLIILLEEETVPSRFNPERLLGYTVRVMRREQTRHIVQIVISVKRGTMEEGLTLGGDHVTTLQFGFLRCHLPDLRAADYAHSANIAVRILTALMDYPNTPEARVRVYGQAWQGLLELEQDPDQLVKYLGIIHTYLKLDTTEQQLYARLYPQEKRHMNQLAESWIEQGWHKGLQEGRQEGLLDGRQQTLAELLTERFGPLDEAVTRRLASASLDELKHWSRRILSAQTLDEVFQLQ